MPSNAFVLEVGGKQYSGWKRASVTAGIEQLAGSFDLTLTERWPEQPVTRPINPGDECSVYIDEELALTGYVDDVIPSHDARSHEVRITGRDRSGDLVDCSAIHKTGGWKNKAPMQIAADICKPYGVTVASAVGSLKAFAHFQLNDSETVFEAISRMARMRGVFVMSDNAGGIVFTRAGTEVVPEALVLGKNILAGELTRSMRDRYKTYLVQGQHAGTDNTTASDSVSRKYQVTDEQVGRHRTLVVLAEDQADGGDCADRAKHERNMRLGKSQRANITVQGARHSGGALWMPNKRVVVRDRWLGIDAELLIASATRSQDEGGTTTQLSLARPEVFDVVPIPEPTGESLL
ncbi:MAG: hypothetical protein OEZ10_11480 [Gammaproteobacteria bacterium]|nr:hypothetical protein [Gammaproteobacteria bacterium]